jgi:hypothetical protein
MAGRLRGSAALAMAFAVAMASCASRPPLPPPAPLAPPAAAPAPPPPPPPPPPHTLSAPPLAVTLLDARTAQVFHIVDELSRWYPEAPSDYSAWAATDMPLDDGERLMIGKHIQLRMARGWGALDQAFSSTAPVVAAAQAAAQKKLLRPGEADDERVLLEHFGARLRPFLESRQPSIVAFESRLAEAMPAASPLFAQLGRLCDIGDPLSVRVVVVPSPASAQREGRLARGTISIEVAATGDSSVASEGAVRALMHALAVAVLQERRGTIASAARKCAESVDDETVEMGLAYAFAPGLVHSPGGDPLRDAVAAERGASLREPRVRAERLGLAVRTELSAALEGGHETIGSFIPKVCDAWANVVRP